MDLGTSVEHNGKPAVRFQRIYQHPIERVWQSVTQPEELVGWFPCAVSYEARVGGTIRFSFDGEDNDTTGTVLAFDPPTDFGFTWEGDELHFTLRSIDHDRCELVLVNVLSAPNTAARNAAGWTVCLEQLRDVLAGRSTRDAVAWQPIYDDYVANGMPSGAKVPGE